MSKTTYVCVLPDFATGDMTLCLFDDEVPYETLQRADFVMSLSGRKFVISKNRFGQTGAYENRRSVVLKIRDFTTTPGGGNALSGLCSAEEALSRLNVISIVRRTLEEGTTVTIDLDGTMGYTAAFLQYFFITLALNVPESLHKCLLIKSLDEPYLAEDVWKYIDECSS